MPSLEELKNPEQTLVTYVDLLTKLVESSKTFIPEELYGSTEVEALLSLKSLTSSTEEMPVAIMPRMQALSQQITEGLIFYKKDEEVQRLKVDLLAFIEQHPLDNTIAYAVYNILLCFAYIHPCNGKIDPLTGGEIKDEDAVVISSGDQFDINTVAKILLEQDRNKHIEPHRNHLKHKFKLNHFDYEHLYLVCVQHGLELKAKWEELRQQDREFEVRTTAKIAVVGTIVGGVFGVPAAGLFAGGHYAAATYKQQSQKNQVKNQLISEAEQRSIELKAELARLTKYFGRRKSLPKSYELLEINPKEPESNQEEEKTPSLAP